MIDLIGGSDMVRLLDPWYIFVKSQNEAIPYDINVCVVALFIRGTGS